MSEQLLTVHLTPEQYEEFKEKYESGIAFKVAPCPEESCVTRKQAIKIVTAIVCESDHYDVAERCGLVVDDYCPYFDFDDVLKALGITEEEMQEALDAEVKPKQEENSDE